MILATNRCIPYRPYKATTPAHWFTYKLDDWATLYVKDINTDTNSLTYRIMGRDFHVLEGPREIGFTREGQRIRFGSVVLPRTDFSKMCL